MQNGGLTAPDIHVNITNMNSTQPDTAGKRPYRMGRRAAAVAETEQRILRAAMALYMDHWLEDLTLDELAARAGVTVQTVLRRFGSKDGVIQAAGEALQQQVTSQRSQAPIGDVAGAIHNLIDHYEATGDMTMRTLAQEARHETLHAFAEMGRALHRAWVETTFAPFLDGRSAEGCDELIAGLVVVTDVYVWKLLRRDMSYGRSQVERHIADMVSAIIERGERDNHV